MKKSRPGSTSVRSVNYATSPLLASKTPPWRSRFVVVMVGAAFLLLLGRAVQVQIVSTDFYQAEGEKRFVHKQALPASRGRIYDRNGLVLATSVAMPSVQVDTKTFAADTAQRRALAGLLGMPAAELDQRLQGSGTVTLRRHVGEADWQEIKALKVRGVQEVREYQRRYPEGESAAHVVGFTNIDDRGQEGIELGFQQQLLGRSGQRTVVRDRLGRVVEELGDQADPVDGSDITLSIDSKVQFFAWQRLRDAVHQHGARAGSVVVLDVVTGEVLALANYPSFDPSQRHHLSGEQLRNRALTDIFEPGSTMKPFTVAAALEAGKVTPQRQIQTAPGKLTIGKHTIGDAHAYGLLTVAEVVAKSSNVGTAKIALDLPAETMWDLYTKVGFGQAPRVAVGAVAGRLRPASAWRPIEQATIGYGYGLSVSLLQLARAYTVFARDGDIVPLSLVKVDASPPSIPVLSSETAAAMRQMLEMAVGPGGTAPRARIEGYRVAGKTGTARKLHNGRYVSNYVASFAGFAPVSDPRLVVAVMIDEPAGGQIYGGQVAAPVFAEIAARSLRTLQVLPDAPATTVVARNGAERREGPL